VNRALLALLVAVSAGGCVARTPFRYVTAQNTCFEPATDPVPGGPLRRSPPFPSLDCRSRFYKTAFVEFKEDGTPFDPDEARKAVALIANEKRRLANGKVITLVYVHGWKNNAGPAAPGGKAQDVERFALALAELGNRARQASPQNPVPVVGVYVAWRGKSLRGPGWFTWLSYWSRRNTGNRIGGAALAALLNDVITTTVATGDDPSRVLLVGHSFGARVLEHAIENGVQLYDPAPRSAATPVRPRVDLVLYVNAATDARLSLGRVLALQTHPIVVRHPDYDPAKCPASDARDAICREYPLLVAITSRGDSATKYVQPIANSINLDKGGATMPPLPSGSFADPIPSAGRLNRSAPGHLRFMQSHDVAEAACTREPADPVTCDPGDARCVFAFRTRGASDACFQVSRRPDAATAAGAIAVAPFNRTPFWIMDVDKRVIADHGDIWNLSTLNMLGELMAPRGFFDADKARMQIQAR